jgi:hypothetical protein
VVAGPAEGSSSPPVDAAMPRQTASDARPQRGLAGGTVRLDAGAAIVAAASAVTNNDPKDHSADSPITRSTDASSAPSAAIAPPLTRVPRVTTGCAVFPRTGPSCSSVASRSRPSRRRRSEVVRRVSACTRRSPWHGTSLVDPVELFGDRAHAVADAALDIVQPGAFEHDRLSRHCRGTNGAEDFRTTSLFSCRAPSSHAESPEHADAGQEEVSNTHSGQCWSTRTTRTPAAAAAPGTSRRSERRGVHMKEAHALASRDRRRPSGPRPEEP